MRTSYESKPLAMFFGPRAELRRHQKAHTHVEGFNNLVKYLVKLRRDGTVNDDDFRELVRMASAAFIEAEISDRVERVLEKKTLDDILLGLWK